MWHVRWTGEVHTEFWWGDLSGDLLKDLAVDGGDNIKMGL